MYVTYWQWLVSTKNFVEHDSYNKHNVPAKQHFSDTMSEMARNFLDIVHKNSDNIRKDKHSVELTVRFGAKLRCQS